MNRIADAADLKALLARAFVVLGLVGLMTGCAARAGYTAPPVFRNLTGFADDRKPLLVEDAQGCHLTVFFKNGKTRTDDLDRTLCHEAALWVEAETALRAATAKAASAQATNTTAP